MSNSFIFPSLLSYCGSIKPSIGFFYAVKNQQKHPIKVAESSIRGTHANYGADKKKENTGSPNLQVVDRANLPEEASQCLVEFTLNILPNALTPHACNEKTPYQQLTLLAEHYKNKQGFHYLASRYADNIIHGRWLWRNKSLVEAIAIEVNLPKQKLKFTLDRTKQPEALHCEPANAKEMLTRFIADAFTGAQSRGLMTISATFDVGFGQEIYPSQELPLDGEDKRGDYTKSRILAQMDGHAILHSQKIGNAIRTIDIWYPDADPNYPLAIEPFGVDAILQTAHRASVNASFYGLLESHYDRFITALDKCKNAAELTDEPIRQLHYVMGCLIRGGVYSGEKKDKKEKKD